MDECKRAFSLLFLRVHAVWFNVYVLYLHGMGIIFVEMVALEVLVLKIISLPLFA